MAEHFQKAVILGCGMIGASFGLALRRRGLAQRVVGLGRSQATLERALELGAVDEIGASLETAVEGADLVYLASPVHTLADYLERLLPLVDTGCLVTDAGSIKRPLVAVAERVGAAAAGFVGGHPMAGSEKTGPQAADADLFVGASYYVVPARVSTPAAVERLETLVKAVGAVPVRVAAELHDEIVAWTSHLPHAGAYALAHALGSVDLPEYELSHGIGGGLRDSTRVASSSAVMWRDIFLGNADHVIALVEGLQASLGELKALIAAGEPEALEAYLSQARAVRERLIAMREAQVQATTPPAEEAG